MIFRELSISEIDFENETFRISEDAVSAPLIASMREVGQLNPVILLDGNPLCSIVCGFRRICALRQMGASKVLARIIENGSSNFRDIFDLAVWDNLSHRDFNPLEKARVLFKLKNDFEVSDRVLLDTYLPRLGLKPHNQILRIHMILHQSHSDFRVFFKEGRLTLASLEYLAAIPASSREIIISAMSRIRMSASLQRKFLSLLDDLSALTGTEPGNVLSNPQILDILQHSRLTPSEKGEKVYAILYRFRYPRVSKAEESFKEKKRSLGLPGSVRITPDPFFEKPDLNVTFSARDAEHFRKLASQINEAARKPGLERLYEID